MERAGLQSDIDTLRTAAPAPHNAALVRAGHSADSSISIINDEYIAHRQLTVTFELRLSETISMETFFLQFGITVIPDRRVRERFRITAVSPTSAEIVVFNDARTFSRIRSPQPVAANIISIVQILAKCKIHSAVASWKAETITSRGMERFMIAYDIDEASKENHGEKVKEGILERKRTFKPYGRYVIYGMKRAGDGSLDPDPGMLSIVAAIKKLRDDGKSLRDIGQCLYLNGIRAPGGKGIWYPPTIADVLKRYDEDYKVPIEELGIAPRKL